jgi:hypothetical protein
VVFLDRTNLLGSDSPIGHLHTRNLWTGDPEASCAQTTQRYWQLEHCLAVGRGEPQPTRDVPHHDITTFPHDYARVYRFSEFLVSRACIRDFLPLFRGVPYHFSRLVIYADYHLKLRFGEGS